MKSKFAKTAAALVLALMAGIAGPLNAFAAGGDVGITQSVKLQGGSAGASVDIPAGGTFIWTVNFTCSNDDCHGGMVRLNFPATLTSGVANYSVSEVSRVIRSSTQVTFVLNPTITVGTSSQITLAMTAPVWSTPDGTTASLTSNFTTSDGQNVSTAASTATVHASNTTNVSSTMVSGGRIGGPTTVGVTYCVVAPGGTTNGPVGIAADSVLVGTIPAGVTVNSTDGGVYNAATNKITWAIATEVTGCVTYSVAVIYPLGSFTNNQATTYSFTWTGKDIGTTVAARTLGTSTNTVTVTNPDSSGASTTRTSVPPQMWVGGAGSIDFTMLNPNDSSQSLDSVEISEEVPEGLALSTITAMNSSKGTAIIYIKSLWGADGIQGNADDSVEYIAASGIAPGLSLMVTVANTMPSGAAGVTGGNYVNYVRAVFGGIPVNSGSLTLLRYNWTLLATTRTGATAAAGDSFPGTANFIYTETVPGRAQVSVPKSSTSSTQVINQPPPPAPSLTTRLGLGNNLSANLLPGVRSVPMSASFGVFGNSMAEPVLLLIQAPDTTIVDSSLVIKNGNTAIADFTVTRTNNFTYNFGQGAKTGVLVKVTFPDGMEVASNTSVTATYTLNLEDTLLGNPRIYNAFSSRSNNSYGTETQWWGTWCDSAADLDGDGLAGNGSCTSGDVKNFPLFFADLIPAVSVSAALTQSVKGSWDSGFVAGPSTGYTTPGASDGFRVSLRNRGTVQMDAATILVLMPRPGDTNVLSSAARNASSATFPVLLSSQPEIPAGLTGVVVSYSTVDNMCRAELGYSPAGCAAPAWSTTVPTPLSAVTAMKIDFGANILNPGVTWNVDMTVTTPSSGATEPDFAIVNPLVNSPSTNEKAKSSSAFVIREFGQSSMLNAAESPAVTLAMPGPFGPAGIAPTAPDKDSTGVGTATQQITVAAPSNGSVRLLSPAGTLSNEYTVPGQGRYTFTNGVIKFFPALGFVGTADPVLYQVTDVFGQTGIATYVASVSLPSGPSASAGTSSGEETKAQTFKPTLPSGGSIVLHDENGLEVTTLVVPNVGTYSVVNGEIKFVPATGYVGTAAIDYTVVDAYGQIATATYRATVTKKAVTPDNGDEDDDLAETGVANSPSGLAGFALLLAGLGALALSRRRRS